MDSIDQLLSSCGEEIRVVVPDVTDFRSARFYDSDGNAVSLTQARRQELVEAAQRQRETADYDLDLIGEAARDAATTIREKAETVSNMTEAEVDELRRQLAEDRYTTTQTGDGQQMSAPEVNSQPTEMARDAIRKLLEAAAFRAERAADRADTLSLERADLATQSAPDQGDINAHAERVEELINATVRAKLDAQASRYVTEGGDGTQEIDTPDIATVPSTRVKGVQDLAFATAQKAAELYMEWISGSQATAERRQLTERLQDNQEVLEHSIFDDRPTTEIQERRQLDISYDTGSANGDYDAPETINVDINRIDRTIAPQVSGMNTNDIINIDIAYPDFGDSVATIDPNETIDNGDGTSTSFVNVENSGEVEGGGSPLHVIPITHATDATPRIAAYDTDARHRVEFTKEGELPGQPGAPPTTDPDAGDGCDHPPPPPEKSEDTKDTQEDFEAGKRNSSPLVLDLDGDGIELIDMPNAGVYFDRDMDGFAERTAWVSPDDALLVLDENENGIIDDHSELFGDATTDGFTELAEHDSNGDGVIDADDAVWARLQLWQDLGSDGMSMSFELTDINEAGIEAIRLYDVTNVRETLENQSITHRGFFDWQDGTQGQIVDAWFDYDQVDALYDGAYALSPLTNDLPSVRGYGALADIRIAISLKETPTDPLFSFVLDIASRSFEEMVVDATLLQTVEDAMYHWAGVSDVDPDSRSSGGGIIDARSLEFLEAMMDEAFLQRGWMSDPGYWASVNLQEGFHVFRDAFFGKLLGQTELSRLFEGWPRYDAATDQIVGVTGLSQAALDEVILLAGQSPDGLTIWQTVVRVVSFGVGFENLDAADIQKLDDAIQAWSPSVTLDDVASSIEFQSNQGAAQSGYNDNDTLTGGVGDDTLSGGYGDDVLYGGLGADRINGGGNNDTLVGQLGADLVSGGSGADTYIYNLGDGRDVYRESTTLDVDVVQFGAGITADMVTITRVSTSDLRLDIAAGPQSGSIVLEDQFNYAAGGGHIELLRFDDGTEITLDDVSFVVAGTDQNDVIYGIARGGLVADTMYGGAGNDLLYAQAANSYDYEINELYGEAGDDTLNGSRGNDIISGGIGNDSLYGDLGNDLLEGGEGRDTIKAASGNDTIVFGLGDGMDTFFTSSGTDTILLGSGIAFSEMQFVRVGNYALHITFLDAPDDQILIPDQFSLSAGYSGAFDLLEFEDGSVVETSSLEFLTTGTERDDVIYGVRSGGSQIDRVSGGDGDDVLYGQAVNSYEYNENFLYGDAGNDSVYGGRGADEVRGGIGDDYLAPDNGNDDIAGDLGDDTIYDFAGDDTYGFAYGDGSDVVNDSNGVADRIVFGTGIAANDVTMWRLGNSTLELSIDENAGGNILFESHFDYRGSVEYLEFDDGSVLDMWQQAFTTYGSDEDDYIFGIRYGGTTVDRMYGGQGNDRLVANGVNSYEFNENWLFGEAGDDELTGSRGTDYLYGGAGADTLSGDSGDDHLFASDMLDVLRGGSGTDTVTAEDDNNAHLILDRFASVEVIRGAAGNDVLDAASASQSIQAQGQSGHDTIFGTEYEDILHGDAGDDALHGGGLADILFGGTGADTLDGGDGADQLFVDDAGDVAHGGEGTDRVRVEGAAVVDLDLSSYTSIERVDGGIGNDTIDASGYFAALTLSGGLGHDNLTGSFATDQVYGQDGDDMLFGFGAQDFLFGGLGADTMSGGAGNDRIYVDNAGDVAHGGSGTDRVSIETDAGVALDLTDWTGIERIDGAAGADFADASGFDTTLTMVGNAGDDTLSGGSGFNVLFGNTGQDVLTGGGMSDVLVGGSDADTMHGGGGDNTFFLDGSADVVTAGSGTDRARFDNDVSGVNLDLSLWSGLDRLIGTDGNDTLDASTQTLDMVINAKAGDDVILGGTGSDFLYGSAGTDTLNGGAGADFLYGGTGADVFIGGEGNDFFYLDDGGDRVEDAGTGQDRAVLTKAGISINVDANWSGLERIDAVAGSETIDATGYVTALTLVGFAGADRLTGGNSADIIFGNEGADTLDGGAGGDDILFGGADGFQDVFVFADGAGADTIRDWESGFDLIDVTSISGVGGFADVIVATEAGNTVITAGSETITLRDFVGTLDETDFF